MFYEINVGCYTARMDIVATWVFDNQTTLITILCIIIVAFVVLRFGEALIKNMISRTFKATQDESRAEVEKRKKTIAGILIGVLNILVWPIAIIMVVSQLGVNIAPLIAGAGIIGLAVGFGAQSLVKDVISGLFIIIENQYRVGDVVQLGTTAGIVESISLRVTSLRDLDGVVHNIPNGTIDQTSNFTKEHSGVNLNVHVGYNADLDKVIGILNKTGADLAEESEWAGKIIEAPQFLRVDNFAESTIEIKMVGKVQPLTQWEVMGELRYRIKKAFDKSGIEFGLPQRVVHKAKA